jgi:dipeptidase E
VAAGAILCGLSAGSLCWFAEGLSAFHGPPRTIEGLGLLPWSNCVHFDDGPQPRAVHGLGLLPASNSVHYRDEPDRRPCFLEAIRTEGVPPGYGVDDGAALLFAGRDLVEVVSARREAGARWVEELDGRAVEVPLAAGELPLESEEVPLAIAELRDAARRAPGRRTRVGGLR